MSELQAALLAIGFGMIVAVYVFGWWQQRKYRRKFGTAFKASHADALYRESPTKAVPLDESDDEIFLTPQSEEVQLEEEEAVPVMEPAIEEIPTAPSQQTPVSDFSGVEATDGPCSLLDARSDFIIELTLGEPSPAAVLGGLWQRKFDFGKPLQVCGLGLNNRQWERAIAESQSLYVRFRIGLQMVDRSGAISVAKLGDFRDLVLGIAKQIKADSAVPDVHETHRYAVELDTFCAEVDQMVGINLVPPGERLIPGAKIAQAASLLGLTLEADGAFHALDTHGHTLFNLINRDSKPFQHHTLETSGTAGITLLLDVPRVEHPGSQFDSMLAAAHELARELQANLVDDRGVSLSDHGLELIRGQIGAVETRMSEYGIAPGSAQARRLFS
ncbi:MAG: cell division protein ZipA C-terminal FtsZ-binding domain-containing protein [Gallionella sp.]|nr:cell division protein ZipA C-terminal FtsZ-binding domain-containing protein [Gallionella sp.]